MTLRSLAYRQTVGIATALAPLYMVLGIALGIFIGRNVNSVAHALIIMIFGGLGGLIIASFHRQVALHRFNKWMDSCYVRHPSNFSRLKPYRGSASMKS